MTSETVEIQVTLEDEVTKTVPVKLEDGALTSNNLDDALENNSIDKPNIRAIAFGHNSKNVMRIDSLAFSDCTGLTEINIRNNVTSIGICAFSGCTGLTIISIPNTVTSINCQAFKYCNGLKEVIVPDDMNENTKQKIKSAINISGLNIQQVEILNISEKLKMTVEIQVTLKDRGTIIVPVKLEDGALTSNNLDAALENNSIDKPNITAIAFDHNSKNMMCTDSLAFFRYTGLTESNIPNNVTSIGICAFSGYTGLTEMNIPNNVTSIGGYTFSGCTRLTIISIPNTVTSIGSLIFNGCSALTEVIVSDDMDENTRQKIQGAITNSGLYIQGDNKVEILSISEKLTRLYGKEQMNEIKTLDDETKVLFAMQHSGDIIMIITIASGQVTLTKCDGAEYKIKITDKKNQPCNLGAFLKNFAQATGHPLAKCSFFLNPDNPDQRQGPQLFSKHGLGKFLKLTEILSSQSIERDKTEEKTGTCRCTIS